MEDIGRSELEVKTIWAEMVKPLRPTPSHLKILKLSLLDQMATPLHVPTILFYSAAELVSYDANRNQLVNLMKTSLSKALSQFYPLAGRFLDDSTLVCNDQGALLIHTQVTCPLKSYFSLIVSSISSDDDHHDHKSLVGKLLPPQDLLHDSHQGEPIPISAWIQLAFQVNVFECGGVVIGWYMSHKILDGISAATFLRHWTGLCQGLGPEHLVEPNFDAIVAAFPPYHVPDPPLTIESTDQGLEELQAITATTTNTVKSFLLKPTAISAIREKAASALIPNPTRVESVVGFLWKCALEAEVDAGASESVGPTNLVLTVDMRPRALPPLPGESIGNLAINVVARAEKKGLDLQLADLVAEIRGAIHEFNDKKVREFQGEKGGEALWKHKQQIAAHMQPSGYKPGTYIVNSQCRAGFKDMDFGFGKPIWIYPFVGIIPIVQMRFIVLVDHIDSSHATEGNGIEAWLTLDKKQMQSLETNPDFLAFASPMDLSIS